MYTNAELTHISKESLKKNFYDAYIERNSSSSSDKIGEKKTVALFASIPTKNEVDFNTGDFILIGKIAEEFKNATEEEVSKSFRVLKSKYKVYTITSVDPCFSGTPHMWHYELECK